MNEFSSSTSAPKDSVQELKAEVELLSKTMTAALFIMILIAASLVFALRKQMLNVREDLALVRPSITQAIDQYEREEKPKVKTFILNLQNYAKTHPDFTPVLSKYSQALAPIMQSGAATPAPATAPAANPAAPTLK